MLGVARIAPDGRFVMVNTALSRMLGYGKKGLLRKTWNEITHPDDRSKEAALLNALLEGKDTSYEMEKRYLSPNDTAVWVTETSSAVMDGTGKLLYRISLIQMNESRQAAEHFRRALEVAESPMLLLDPHVRIRLFNASCERLLGYSSGELTGKLFSILMDKVWHGHQSKRVLEDLVRRTYEPNQAGHYVMSFRTRAGLSCSAECHAIPINTPAGKWILMSLVNIKTRQDSVRTRVFTIPLFEREYSASQEVIYPAKPRRALNQTP
jgi:PAS domain S-box-containing protein